MAGPTREQVYQALFTQLSSAADFRTKSRRYQPPPNIGIGDMPALFQVQMSENARPQRNVPVIWLLKCDAIIYVPVNDPTLIPSQVLNPYIDAISTALAPSPLSDVQTLGGLCQHCWIEGDLEIYEGVLTELAIAVIPISILVPGLN